MLTSCARFRLLIIISFTPDFASENLNAGVPLIRHSRANCLSHAGQKPGEEV